MGACYISNFKAIYYLCERAKSLNTPLFGFLNWMIKCFDNWKCGYAQTTKRSKIISQWPKHNSIV